jgi:hypothetical protein
MAKPDNGTERHHMENPDDGTERHHMENPDDGTERYHMENPDDGTERYHMENPDDAPQKRNKEMKKNGSKRLECHKTWRKMIEVSVNRATLVSPAHSYRTLYRILVLKQFVFTCSSPALQQAVRRRVGMLDATMYQS